MQEKSAQWKAEVSNSHKFTNSVILSVFKGEPWLIYSALILNSLCLCFMGQFGFSSLTPLPLTCLFSLVELHTLFRGTCMIVVTTEIVALTLASASWHGCQDFSTEPELYHIISGLLANPLCLKILIRMDTFWYYKNYLRTDLSFLAVNFLVKPFSFFSCKQHSQTYE